MNIIETETGYIIRKNGQEIALDANDVSILTNQFMKNGLRDSIEYCLREADGDWVDLDKYPDSFDELVDEIFTDLEDEVDYGNYPGDDDINDKISDVATYYDMLMD